MDGSYLYTLLYRYAYKIMSKHAAIKLIINPCIIYCSIIQLYTDFVSITCS